MNDTKQSKKTQADVEAVLGTGEYGTSSLLRRWRSKVFVGVFIATAVGAFFAWVTSGSKDAIKYVTEPAVAGDLIVIVTATGSVQPTNQVDISSELSGTIREVLVDYNTKVAIGQRLAELDTDKLKASVENSRAKLAASRAKVKDAEATVVEKRLEYDRKRDLAPKNVVSVHDLDVAKATYERALAGVESAEADVAAAAADLKLNETNLAKTCICSPINGVVLKRNVEPGQTVASSLQAPVLFSIAEDLTKMEIQVDVDEADVGKVTEGQKATFTVDAYPDRNFSAEIRELRFGSEVVQGVVTYKAVLTADNSQLLLRPGMTATAEITVQKVTNAVSVPNAALRFAPPATDTNTDGRSFLQKLIPGRPQLRPPSAHITDGPDRNIWILTDGKPQKIAVTIGPTDGKRSQVVNGDVQPGQAVIVDTAATNK